MRGVRVVCRAKFMCVATEGKHSGVVIQIWQPLEMGPTTVQAHEWSTRPLSLHPGPVGQQPKPGRVAGCSPAWNLYILYAVSESFVFRERTLGECLMPSIMVSVYITEETLCIRLHAVRFMTPDWRRDAACCISQGNKMQEFILNWKTYMSTAYKFQTRTSK